MFFPIAAAAFGLLALAAAQTPQERLSALAAKNGGVVSLNPETWELLTSNDRTWSAVIQMTALGAHMKCGPCKDFDPVFKDVAKSWSSVSKAHRDEHFFATLDFEDGQEVFKKMKLASAPAIYLYPPTQGPRRPTNGKTDPTNYDFNNFGSDPNELAIQVSTITPIAVPYKPPMNWGLVGTVASSVFLIGITAHYTLPLLLSRWFWAAVTICTSLVMTSGFMFVRIRGMPYRTADSAMIGGFQNQLGAEIWTIAFTYGTLAFSFLVLTLLVPRQTSESRQRLGIYMFTAVNILFYSILLRYFRVKNGGYPFKLFF